MSSEKTLVIILAETRSWELTYDSFEKNLLVPYNADLCLCVARNDREVTNNPFYKKAKEIFTYEEPENWCSAFDHASSRNTGKVSGWERFLLLGKNWNEFSFFLGGLDYPTKYVPGSGAILLFFRWFLRNCIKNPELFWEYDRFIITRSDYMYTTPAIPLELLSNDRIWIPEGEDYGGMTDRHIICNNVQLMNILSIADPVINNDDALFHDLLSLQNEKWNLEWYVKYMFDRLNISPFISRYPYTMYTVKSPDEKTRWSNGMFNEELGYNIKYPSEYKRATIAKKIFNVHGSWNAQSVHELTAALEPWK